MSVVRIDATHIGSLAAVEYVKAGKTYRHTFKRRPALHTTTDGTVLMAMPVRVTERGIEDARPRSKSRRKS